MNIYTTGGYLSNNPSWHAEDSPWKSSHIIQILKDNSIIPNTICEIGCGAGKILKNMSNYFKYCSFTGYEVAPDAFEIAVKNQDERLSYFLGDGLEDNRFFDVALAIDIFEHVDDYLGFLHKMKSKGMYKVYHIPLDMTVQLILRRRALIEMRNRVGHLHYFTKDTALATLKYTGHEILDWRYTAPSIDLPKKTLSARMVFYPRKFLHKILPDFSVRLLGGFSIIVLCK